MELGQILSNQLTMDNRAYAHEQPPPPYSETSASGASAAPPTAQYQGQGNQCKLDMY